MLFSRVRGVSLLALTGITVLGMLFARPLTRLFAAHAQPHEFERTVTLTRAVFPYIFFMGTAALGMAALHAKRRFAVAAFAPGLLNVALLVATFALPGVFGSRGIDTVLALATGALAVGFLQVAAQWPALRRLGYAGAPPSSSTTTCASSCAASGPLPSDLASTISTSSYRGAFSRSWGRRAKLLLVGDAPVRLPAGHLRDGALDRGAAFAVDARGQGREGRAGADLGARHGPGDVRRDPRERRLRGIRRADCRAALPARRVRRRRGARDGTGAPVAGGGAIWTVAAVRQTVPALYALGDTRTPVVVSAIDLARSSGWPSVPPMGHVGISVAVAGFSAVQMMLLLAGLRRRLGRSTLERWRLAAVRIAPPRRPWLASLDGGGAPTLPPSPRGLRAAAPGLVATLVFGTVFLLVGPGNGIAADPMRSLLAGAA